MLINLEDYKHLQGQEQNDALRQWEAWIAEANALSDAILTRRQGQPFDVDMIEQAAKAERERRWDGALCPVSTW